MTIDQIVADAKRRRANSMNAKKRRQQFGWVAPHVKYPELNAGSGELTKPCIYRHTKAKKP